jgi:hypothetical protein
MQSTSNFGELTVGLGLLAFWIKEFILRVVILSKFWVLACYLHSSVQWVALEPSTNDRPIHFAPIRRHWNFIVHPSTL